jgi:hypothetical protein
MTLCLKDPQRFLSWLGFTDIHTGIDKYYVSLGSQYMMDDLNKVTDRMM